MTCVTSGERGFDADAHAIDRSLLDRGDGRQRGRHVRQVEDEPRRPSFGSSTLVATRRAVPSSVTRRGVAAPATRTSRIAARRPGDADDARRGRRRDRARSAST